MWNKISAWVHIFQDYLCQKKKKKKEKKGKEKKKSKKLIHQKL